MIKAPMKSFTQKSEQPRNICDISYSVAVWVWLQVVAITNLFYSVAVSQIYLPETVQDLEGF